MSKPTYNWKRFWCPRGATINLSDGGYLYDPDSQWGRIYNPEVKPFEAISETPCLALLGEPGIGKTRTIAAEGEAAEIRIKKEGDDILRLNLRSYGSEDRLVRNLFESKEFLSWREGGHRLYIFLDSLDEGLLRIDTLAALLADEFKRYRIERLCLRIVSRTAEWPNSLETELRQLWGEKAVEVYELTPLRRIDVVEAAKANGIDPDAFLAGINQAEVTPLAIKPVTLDFLLSTYQRHGSFPKTQAELYLDGCRLLCEETNKDRRAAQLTGDFSADQRLTVAARIAAVSIFANRYAVWTTVDQGEVPEEDVTVRELSGGREQARSDEFEVTEKAVREALGTGLFSARGPNRLGWAHQTYAEFLAAYYLVQRQMTLTQMMSLITHPSDPEKKLVPQLHETAAWLAGMVPEVFRKIIESDPEVLLRSDVATADVKDRVALVGALLGKCNEDRSLVRYDWGMFERYKKLTHLDLVEQLRPYICDSTKSRLARSVAIDIAEACDLQVLQDDLVKIALDPSQPLQIRVAAARTVARIGNNEAKVKLKPLAYGEASDDPDDELKGCGLQAVWPSNITSKELFKLLTFPKNEALYGTYESFLLNDLVPHLQPDDLPTGLKWAGSSSDNLSSVYPFKRLADSILLRACEYLDVPEVLEEFAQVVLTRLKNHREIVNDRADSLFGKFLNENEEKRRRLLETMLHILGEAEEDISILFHSNFPLVLASDIPWMISRLRVSVSKKVQRAWAQVVERIFDWREPCQTDAILIACQEIPILAEAFALLLKPIEINSPEAHEMKARYLRIQEWQNKRESRPLLNPSPAERIAALLNKFESRDLSAWWQLNMELTLEPDSTHYGDELESDLTALPGWRIAESITRRRIIEAAKKYLLEQTPETSKWFGTDTFYRPAFAGYRALRLLLQEDPSWVSLISSEVWKKWSSIILAYPVSSGPGKTEFHRELVRKAYEHAASEIIEYLMVLIDKENERHGDIFILREVEGCWDVRLTSALLAKLKDESLKPRALGCLLGNLLDHKVEEARAFAETIVSLSQLSREEQRSKAVIAACILMTHVDNAGWSIVWPSIQQDIEFGREVISAAAHEAGIHRTQVSQRLTEDQLADLYVWLVHQCPYAEDSERQDTKGIGPEERVAEFRDSLLQHLKGRGTPQACEAIRRIARELLELDWLKWTLLEAQAIARRQTWTPPQPKEVLAIASSQQKRLVQSGEQLLDVLMESLKELEKRLQGETPQVEFLWDRVGKNGYKPKDENSFSNYVEDHLRSLSQRGVIANREVEIRRNMGARPGERVDIQVDAVSQRSGGEEYDRISAIIEVKGCWHEELKNAMKTQLVGRYLNEARCQHGLYLVGWFNCDQWDNEDSRRGRAPKFSIEEARKQFDAQASELSQSGTQVRAFVLNTALR